MLNNRAERIGERHKTPSGWLKIVDYNNKSDVLVRFTKTGFQTTANYGNIVKGRVKDPLVPTIFDVGFFGDGPYSRKEDTNIYDIWIQMLSRCYGPDKEVKHASYTGCSVVPRWHNFQLFCHDVRSMPNFGKPGFELDKDLRRLGNRKYGPKQCSFVPKAINCLLNMHQSRGERAIGVRKHHNRYVARLSINGTMVVIGRFDDEASAVKAYCKARLAYVLKIAKRHRREVHNEVWKTLTRLTPDFFVNNRSV